MQSLERTPTTKTLQSWKIDLVHTEIGFTVKHLMVTNVKGRFNEFSGTIEIDESDATRSRAVLEIAVSSIDTQTKQRDDHLRSLDFFDLANHPKIIFQSRRIERGEPGRFTVIGDLTIRGITREVALDMEVSGPQNDPWGGVRMGLKATTAIDRRDYGVNWNQVLDKGGVAVGNEVRINIELELIRE
jgi:polyisoprenoid-binding protein YceI